MDFPAQGGQENLMDKISMLEYELLADQKNHANQHMTFNFACKIGASFAYDVLDRIGNGTFGTVFSCRHKITGEFAVCKRLKYQNNTPEKDFDYNIVREIWAHRKLPEPHENVLHLLRCFDNKMDSQVELIYEQMDCDLRTVIENPKLSYMLTEQNVRFSMFQMLSGLSHLHNSNIIHADLKPENILVDLKKFVLKIGDLGNATERLSYQAQERVGTCSNRAPEILLTNGFYSFASDLWSIGCIFAELMIEEPLFSGKNEGAQISQIHELITGPPNIMIIKYIALLETGRLSHGPGTFYHERFEGIVKILKEYVDRNKPFSAEAVAISDHLDENCMPRAQQNFRRLKSELLYRSTSSIHTQPQAWNLLTKFLQYDPGFRTTAAQALEHDYFYQ